MEVLKQKVGDWTPLGRIGALSDFLKFSHHTDVTFIAEGRPLQAHRLILASFSPFIKKILQDAGSETSIFLPDLSFSKLQSLLHFVYTGTSYPGESSEGFIKNLFSYFAPNSSMINLNQVPKNADFCYGQLICKTDLQDNSDEEESKSKIENNCKGFLDSASLKILDGDISDTQFKNKCIYNFKEPVFWPCVQCSQSFTTERALKKHIHNKHDQTFQCPHCGKVFKAARSLMFHQNSHSGNKVQCDQCDKCFTSPARLNAHKIKHNNPDAITCDKCDVQLSNVAALHNHWKIHTGVKNHCCEVCGKAFIYSTQLNNHRRVHTGEKPYQCTICCKHFRVKNHLKDHLTTHTGEKKFSCEVCKQAFNIRSNMNRHMKKVHYNQPEEI